MSMRDFAANWLARAYYRVNPSGKISTGPDLEAYRKEEEGRPKKKDLEKFYRQHVLVFRGVNYLAQATLGRGYYIEGKEEKAVRLCKQSMALSSFEPSLLTAISHVFVYGEGSQEIAWNGNVPAKYKVFDPKSFDPKYDERGIIKHFLQTIDIGKPEEFELDRVIFYKFWQIADSPRGIGLVEPLKVTLEIEEDQEKAIKEAIEIYANPQWWVTKEGASDAEITALKTEFKDIKRQHFFGTSERYKLNLISMYHKFPDLSYYMDYVLNKICAGLMIPKPVLLAVGEATNRATLEALIESNQYEISLMQKKLTQIIEEQLFTPIVRKNKLSIIPDLKWFPLSTEDEKTKAEIFNLMSKSCVKLFEKGLMTEEEVRSVIEKYK